MSATLLRPVTLADSTRLLTWRNDPDIARWMYSDHAIAPEEHESWFAAAMADPARTYWVIEADGVPVGLANFYDIDLKNGRASWAYYLAAAEVRGKGVGACVEFQMLEEAFVARGLNKLWCEVLVDNKAVTALHRSFGFREEALFRRHVRKQGRLTDVIGLGLLREEWMALRADSHARLTARGHAVALPLLG